MKAERILNIFNIRSGERQKSLGQLYECCVAQKGENVIESDERHILAKQFELLPSGKRYRS